jgi:site-specific DNA-methyltransferase (adenine-specific)
MKNKIICGDCLEVMKEIPDKSIDLILTDPPYGITNYSWDIVKNEMYFDEIHRVGKKIIIFGGNFMPLPKKDGWIIWDKMKEENPTRREEGDNKSNDFEMIWTNFLSKNKIIRFLYNGNIQMFQGEKKKPDYKIGKRMFSSQKPIRLIERLVEEYSEPNQTILDPFLGSGTTALACQNTGRNFIGIEINPEYCKIAEQRLKQKPLF